MTLLMAAGRKTAAVGFTGSDFRDVKEAHGGNVGSVTVTKPTGCVDGDLLVAAVVVGWTTAVTPPSGWTEVSGSPIACASGTRLHVYTKIAASEGASHVWPLASSDDLLVIEACYAGPVSSATPTATATQTGDTGVAQIVVPSVTTTDVNQIVVYFLAADGSKTYSGAGGSNNFRVENHAAPVTGAIADELIAASGAVGTRTFPVTSGANVAGFVAAFAKG